MKYSLYKKLTYWRDSTPLALTEILDWIRYEVLYDPNDERHHY